ncbi:hypothetical protein D3C73_1139130 [compost metagenome]
MGDRRTPVPLRLPLALKILPESLIVCLDHAGLLPVVAFLMIHGFQRKARLLRQLFIRISDAQADHREDVLRQLQQLDYSGCITTDAADRNDAEPQRFSRHHCALQRDSHIHGADQQRINISSRLKRLAFQLSSQLGPVEVHAEHQEDRCIGHMLLIPAQGGELRLALFILHGYYRYLLPVDPGWSGLRGFNHQRKLLRLDRLSGIFAVRAVII